MRKNRVEKKVTRCPRIWCQEVSYIGHLDKGTNIESYQRKPSNSVTCCNSQRKQLLTGIKKDTLSWTSLHIFYVPYIFEAFLDMNEKVILKIILFDLFHRAILNHNAQYHFGLWNTNDSEWNLLSRLDLITIFNIYIRMVWVQTTQVWSPIFTTRTKQWVWGKHKWKITLFPLIKTLDATMRTEALAIHRHLREGTGLSCRQALGERQAPNLWLTLAWGMSNICNTKELFPARKPQPQQAFQTPSREGWG